MAPCTKTYIITHVFLLLFFSTAYGANNWTATLDSARITQGEGSGTLTITISNDAQSDRSVDNKLTFYLDTTHFNFSGATSVPAGWQIRLVTEDEITIEATGAGISPGASETFTIGVTGPEGNIIPNASTDVTDSELIKIEHPGFPRIDATGYTWERKGLKVVLDAVPGSLGLDQTITLTAYVTNRTTGTVTGITCSEPVLTGTGSATLTTGPSPSFLNLDPGETQTIQWTFTSSTEGSIVFTTAATGTNVSSAASSSETLVSGGFTCLLSIDKTQIVSGENVTATMTLSNNGSTSLGNIIPDTDLVNLGTASASKQSGPVPSSIASLSPGASADIVYVYTVTGSTGQTYQFEGKAYANGPVTSNTAASKEGILTEFSASVSPYVLSSGATNVTVSWEIFNNSSSQLKKVIFDPFPTWTVDSVTPHADWSFIPNPMVPNPDNITFNAGSPIAVESSGTFVMTFSSVPAVTSDTDYNFRIELEGPGLKPTSINTTLTVTAYEISLSHSPAGPLDADGTSQYTMTAVLTQGGFPVPDTIVSFSATAGSLSSGTAVTNSSGEAAVTLTAPSSTSDTSSTVTASCSTASAQDTVGFTGVTGPNIQYVGGTLNVTTGAGTVYDSGGDLTTAAGSAVVTSASATWVSDYIQAGDDFDINSGADAGTYSVSSVDSETQITLNSSLSSTASGISYEIKCPPRDPSTGDIGKAQGTNQSFCVDVVNQGDQSVTLGVSSTLSFTDGTYTYSANLSASVSIGIGAQKTLYFDSAAVDGSFSEGNFQGTLTLAGDTPALSGPVPGAAFNQTRTISDTINIFTPTYVKLARLETKAMDGAVKILWRTVIEINNFGFHIYRRVKGTSAYTRITPDLIPGKYDSAQSAEYEFTDTEVRNGTVYEYILEDWDVSNRKTVHGPVAAMPDAENPWGEVWDKGWKDNRDTMPEEYPSFMPGIFTVTELPEGGMEVSVRIPEPEFTETVLNGKTYIQVDLGRASLRDRQGEPEIPVLAAAVDIPAGMRALAECIQADSQTVSAYPVIPAAQRYTEYSGAVRSVQQSAAEEGSVYSQEGWFPASAFEIEELGMQGHRHILAVRVFPVRTDPSTGKLEIYTHIKLRLTFEQAPPLPVKNSTAGTTPPPEGIQPSLKVGIHSTGVYRVTYSDCAAAGWFPLDPRNISLYDNGKEIPALIQGEEDGSFDTGDCIEFYGISRVTPYADTNIYWFVETTQPGLRIQTFDAAHSGTDLSASSQETAVHTEEDNMYSGTCPAIEGADRWFWKVLSTSAPEDFRVNLTAVDTGYAGTCSITVTMHSLSWDDTVDPDHHVLIDLNSTRIGNITWDGRKPYVFKTEQLHSLLNDGVNTITVTVPQDTGAPYDGVYVDSIDITYHRNWEAADNSFSASVSGPGQVTVYEFDSSGIRVLDITDPEQPCIGENAVITEEAPGAWSINFKAGAGETSYTAFTDTALLSPESYTLDTPSDLRADTSPADMIVVSYPAFLPDIEPLAQRRRSQGLSVRSVSVQDVFDEFSDGEPEPQGIRNFVKYVFEHCNGPAPEYLILVGDSTYDPRGLEVHSPINYVPTYLVYTEYFGETASDLYYTEIAGDDPIPDLMAGRIPARSRAQVADYVKKVLDYEDQPYGGAWEGRFILAADNAVTPAEEVFVPYSNTLALHASSQVERVKIYLSTYGDPADAHTDLYAAIGSGAALATYVGHSGFDFWADETPSLLTTADIDSLANGTRLPFTASFVCLDGFFLLSDESFSCISERFVLNPNGGAVAAWSPGSITSAYDKKIVGDTFTREIFVRDARTPAAAILPALEAGWAQGLKDIQDVLRTYILFGYPSVRIRIATPIRPSGIELKPKNWKILLTWKVNPERAVHTYHVYRAESETGPYTRIDTVTEPRCSDTNVTAAETYYYYVKAETDSGFLSSSSDIVSGAPEYNDSGSGCMPGTAHPASTLPFFTAILFLLGIRYLRPDNKQ